MSITFVIGICDNQWDCSHDCLLRKSCTVLSRASAHGRSQLKRQNLRVGGYMENSLKWFNYPHARAHPGCEVSCHGTEWTWIIGSSVVRWGQSDSGESCIVLQSGPTCSLVAKFPQHSIVACSTQNFMLQGKNTANEATDGCVWTFDAWCRVAQRTYVPSDSLRENLAWWVVTRRTLKNHKTVKIRGGRLQGMGACSGQYGNSHLIYHKSQ